MYAYFFSGSEYIRVQFAENGVSQTDPGYPASLQGVWGVPPQFENGIDAALYSGSVCFFFKGNQYIEFQREVTGPGTLVENLSPISDWNWPNGFGADGIDAALWSGQVTYFFKGNQYIRVTRSWDTDRGKTDPGYPKTIADGWGWPAPFSDGIKGALPAGSSCFFFSGKQYIKVMRGLESRGFIAEGYPKAISNWNFPGYFGIGGIQAALYSGGSLVAPLPGQQLVSSLNYFLAAGGISLLNTSVTINFDNDFTTTNGFSFQLNAYSSADPTTNHSTWQQYVVYQTPYTNILWARIFNWKGTRTNRTDMELLDGQKAFVGLEGSNKIPLGSSINWRLLNDAGNKITGCVFTYTDPSGKITATTILIPECTLWSTPEIKPSSADEAPIVAFTFNIGGDYNGNRAVVTQGQGTVTYSCNHPLTALNDEPSFTTFKDGTGESANIVFARLPQAGVNVSQLWGQTPAIAPTPSIRPGRKLPMPPHLKSK
jgi:hypothetical protein